MRVHPTELEPKIMQNLPERPLRSAPLRCGASRSAPASVGPAGRQARVILRVLGRCLLAAGALMATHQPASAQTHVKAWGRQVFDSAWNDEAFAEVTAGWNHTLARRGDGSIAAWGDNGFDQCNVPVLPAGTACTKLAAGQYHSLAVRDDGSLAAWGLNGSGQCNVPALPAGR